MPDYITRLIAGGESQTLDFKFEVSDFRKIARTLVAFSNTDGGRLLVGVKDNGSIAGVRSEEEYYMIEGATRLYCRPEIRFSVKEWQVDRKKILEVIIDRGKEVPYKAMDDDGQWTAYIRQGDQNFKASRIRQQAWIREKSGKPLLVQFRQGEQFLIRYLERNGSITLARFRRLAGLSQREAEAILTDFLMLGIIKETYSGFGELFILSPDYKWIIGHINNNDMGGY
ncbi:MAG: ATP-binding protein [Bacteroidales bacterium]|jgi:predicted HTH transcriptional regulator|nr:ATP-binding protein [Bacteroidales bacterium]